MFHHSVYPPTQHMRPMNVFRIAQSKEGFDSLPGSDCWGVFITKRDGSIVPFVNSYVDRDDESKWRSELRFRDKIDGRTEVLTDLLEVGEVATLLMFGDASWKMDAIRVSPKQIAYATYGDATKVKNGRTQTSNL